MMYPQHEATVLQPLNPSRIEEHGVSIRDYIDLLIEGKKAILGILLVVLTLASLYLVLASRTYKADALLRIDKNKALLAANLRSDNNAAAAETENPRAQREVEILRSRSVLGKVVEDLNLMIEYQPRYFPLIGETLARKHDKHDGIARPWWGFSGWAWGGERLKIQQFEVPDRYLDKEFTLVALSDSHFQLLSPKDQILAEGELGELISADIGKPRRYRSSLVSWKPIREQRLN